METPEVESGRIIISDRVAGSAFAIAPGLVITAAHVLGSAPTDSIYYVPPNELARCVVLQMIRPPRLDVALLKVVGSARPIRGILEASEGTSWVAHSQPRPRDPILDGVITGTTRGISHYG